MDEKELGDWVGRINPYYSYMDYPRISVDPAYDGGDITATRRVTNLAGLDDLDRRMNMDMDLDMDAIAEMATRLMGDIDKKTTQSAREKLLPKKDLTLAETMDLLSRGLKPYFYNLMENNMVELTLATEVQRGNSDIHWLAPKIAEKIQERYAEMNRLAEEKRKAIRDYDAKIEELEKRVELILQNGTDLII